MYNRAKLHFKKADPILYQSAQLHDIADIRRSKDVFGDLIRAIVNQQLSSKAADTIYSRLESLVHNRSKSKEGRGKFGKSRSPVLDPRSIAGLKASSLRKCGLSSAKAATIKGVAKAIIDGEIDLSTIHTLTDEKIIDLLTSLKGIGQWTAEMILMSSLGRIDIFSKGDLGLRKGIMRLYGLKKMPSDMTMERLGKAWSPYRTYAARLLWKVADEAKDK